MKVKTKPKKKGKEKRTFIRWYEKWELNDKQEKNGGRFGWWQNRKNVQVHSQIRDEDVLLQSDLSEQIVGFPQKTRVTALFFCYIIFFTLERVQYAKTSFQFSAERNKTFPSMNVTVTFSATLRTTPQANCKSKAEIFFGCIYSWTSSVYSCMASYPSWVSFICINNKPCCAVLSSLSYIKFSQFH